MSKRKSRRLVTRRIRHVLNAGADVGSRVSGRRLSRQWYGTGLTRRVIKGSENEIPDFETATY